MALISARANLRAWIHRQSEFRKAKKTDSDTPPFRRRLTKKQQESIASLESNYKDHLTGSNTTDLIS
jgi:hypothetical protein